MTKNYALCYQVAIEAIHEIRETQIASDTGNFSRDLYPFRAIIAACLDKTTGTDESVAAIDEALQKHRDYRDLK